MLFKKRLVKHVKITSQNNLTMQINNKVILPFFFFFFEVVKKVTGARNQHGRCFPCNKIQKNSKF